MTEYEKNSLKVGILFSAILFLILIFLLRVTFISIYKPEHFISRMISHTDLALRGKIISEDNYTVAENKKIYSLAIIKKYINPNKENLLINLLSIYTNTPKSILRHKIYDNNLSRVVLLKNIPYKIKKNLSYLSNVLTIKKVFLPSKSKIIYGLDIYEEPSIRYYPFKNRLEPVLGYARWNSHHKRVGMGLEKYYDEILMPKQNGYTKGYRDVRNHIIFDNESIIRPRIDGNNLYLNINLVLQGKIENILDKLKPQMKAQELLAIVMDSKTGKVITIATSNRYNPMHIRKQDIPYLKISHIQYSYEPGSVMKPITLAMLLEHKKVNIYEIINAHNGIFYFKKNFTIYDDEPFKFLNVIQAVIHSSNIVFAQLGLRLTPEEFRSGLLKFGFYQKSGIDLPYEYKGVLFNLRGFKSQIHRASNAFGYAMQVNLVQLVKAYNSFNNNGIMIIPKIAYKYGNIQIPTKKIQVISPTTAQTVLNILRQVVLKGTARATNIPGLFIAGKTGTAKINKNGQYIKGLYNSSFIGFVNDKTHKYTIGVLAIKPDEKRFFASQTAVVVFKNIVETMIEMNMLKPEVDK